VRHLTRGGDAVDGANYGTNGSLSGFDDGFDLRPARITVKGAWLLAVSFGCHVELGYVPGSFTVSEAWVAIVDVRHVGRFMSSLNWILRPQVKLMFELGAGRVSGTAADGNLLLVQLRMSVYWY
jgi:hypothetical protein